MGVLRTMRYILQINTGSFTRTADLAVLRARLTRCLDALDVERAIYGWSPDRAINEEIVRILEDRGVEKYLWLPVFSEIHTPESERFTGVDGAREQALGDVCEGDSFDFVCQSSAKNLARAAEVFDDLTRDLPVEGAFLDRIRYASAAGGAAELYGCWCPRCRRIYKEAGVDTQAILRADRARSADDFIIEDAQGGAFRYADANLDKLMRTRRTIISASVQKLCDHFHGLGKKVALDTFAPCVADFVGQDLRALGRMADFIKPMVYLKTNAPAGLPYELQALGPAVQDSLRRALGADPGDMEATVEQLRALLDAGAQVAPGVDANRVERFCDASCDYVLRFADLLEAAGFSSMTLSWDVTRIPQDVIDALARR